VVCRRDRRRRFRTRCRRGPAVRRRIRRSELRVRAARGWSNAWILLWWRHNPFAAGLAFLTAIAVFVLMVAGVLIALILSGI
jgi:hypothetical protein